MEYTLPQVLMFAEAAQERRRENVYLAGLAVRSGNGSEALWKSFVSEFNGDS